MNQLTIFNYNQLDAETRIVVQQRTSEIKSLMRRTAQDIIDIGQKLIDVKARLGHGNFGGWLAAEFGWTDRTAQRFINVAKQFENRQIVGFEPSALYLLAAPSTPDEARDEALTRAESGETITHAEAKDIVAAHKSAPITPALTPAEKPNQFEPGSYYAVNRDRSKGDRQVVNDPLPSIEACLDKYPTHKPTRGDHLNLHWAAFYADCEIVQPIHTIHNTLTSITSNQQYTVEGYPITEDGVILRFHPTGDRGWCVQCGDWRNFLLINADIWACKTCDWRVADDAIQLWESESKPDHESRWREAGRNGREMLGNEQPTTPDRPAVVRRTPEERIAARPARPGQYRVILADPPWQYTNETIRGSAENHYATMSAAELTGIPVGDLAAADCALFLWVTWPTIQQAFHVATAWGFEYRTCAFVWAKLTKNAVGRFSDIADDANWAFGGGAWTRANTEACLLFMRGAPPRFNADVRQLLIAPSPRHSEKPDEQYTRIERLFAGPYIEIFARQQRDGWIALGNEIDGQDIRDAISSITSSPINDSANTDEEAAR